MKPISHRETLAKVLAKLDETAQNSNTIAVPARCADLAQEAEGIIVVTGIQVQVPKGTDIGGHILDLALDGVPTLPLLESRPITPQTAS